MHTQTYTNPIGYFPANLEDMIRAAAAESFAKEYGWFMLQYAVYDEWAGKYVVALGV